MLNAQYFTADWCQPCKTFKPIAEKAFAEAKIPLMFIDVEKSPHLSEVYGISSVPTIVITDGPNGQVDRIVGAFPEPRLRERLAKLVG
jgi:thioredoxin 1